MPTNSLTKIPVKLLGDLISPRALERMLIEGAQSRGVHIDHVDIETLEDVLKRDVFKRLQLSIPAPLAKRRIIEVLDQLNNPEPEEAEEDQGDPLLRLEEASRKFSLYFDWTEAQRLRALLGIAHQDKSAGKDIRNLVQEGNDLIESMERRLNEGLVAQSQDLAELKADLVKVESVGGREVRRLESLISQIEDAQERQELTPAEVERARNYVFKLRKKLESSMMQPSGSPQVDSQKADETAARVQAIEKEHVLRRLHELSDEFAPLFRITATVQQQHQNLCQKAEEGELSAEAVDDWRNELERAKDHVLDKQREELLSLEQTMRSTFGDDIPNESRVALDVARLTINNRNLANDEMSDLRSVINAMSYAPNVAARILDQQRDLTDLERSAREVKGAAEDLMPRIDAAREELVRGREVDLAPLYATLERYMGEAAQQREDFDARADNLIAEYDKIRSMRGERAQELGRLAETLRSQRLLGPMSAKARERYAQSLENAEALLSDARAEFKAAQEVTSNFGEDALSGLLDDLMDEVMSDDVVNDGSANSIANSAGSAKADQDEYKGFFSADNPPPTPQQPDADFVPSDGNTSNKVAKVAKPSPINTDNVETWEMAKGEVTVGSLEPDAMQLAMMLSLADALSLSRLDMGDEKHVWSARHAGHGGWRVARALDWETMDEEVGEWLDNGVTA